MQVKHNKLFAFFLGCVCIALLVFLFVNKLESQNAVQKIQVVTSFYPMYFFASKIGGDKAQVNNITPSGSEPHEYEPTARDIALIEDSQLLVINGMVEPWSKKIIANLQNKNIRIVMAGYGLFSIPGDPHVWLNTDLAKKEVKAILKGFTQADPKNGKYFYKNADILLSQIDELSAMFNKKLAGCRKSQIVTSHAAFGYLAQEYGLTQIPITGISPDEEPTQKHLIDISRFIKTNNVKYIFFEQLVSPKLAQTLAQETGVDTLVLDPLEGIPEAEQQKGADYFSVMKQNLHNLQIALVCQ